MGTNYYWKWEPCECCGNEDEPLHIGKSSQGWVFMLRIHPGIQSLDDWKKLWKEHGRGHIEDEYGQEVSMKKMLDVITNRSHSSEPYEGFYEENHALPGPNGLARSRDCTRHGEGTWDYCIGDFC